MQDPQKNTPIAWKFYCLLAGYVVVIFFANWHHLNQQGIFNNEYEPIANHLLNGDGYVISIGNKILYPIWGYSFLTMIGELIGSPIFFLAVLQAALCIIGIYFFYKLFSLEKKYWHILLFTPFIALASVRWPDAIVGVLLIAAAYCFKVCLKNRSKKYAAVTGILLGILLNFRSEYLGILILFLILAITSLFLRKNNLLPISLIIVFFALVALMPWSFYSHSIDKHFRLTSTNGGGVLYISLGQLPNNPWGIMHSDSVAFAVAKEQGINDPYSTQGDSLLTAKFSNDIENEPIAYSEKIGYNVISSIVRGVYVGEFGGAIEKTIKVIFILLFDIFLVLAALYFAKNYRKTLVLSIFLLVLYKFCIISFIQYEPRHMNAIYLFLLGPSLLFLKERRK